ncbi:MAG: ATP-dependent RecD-like DNA helicase, partial [Eubacteriales bacterium]|nr:ATP-dependent RecD-like DNA helicase [Eubacteriales bacterium]
MIQIKATVEKITYRNDENGYTVLRAFVEGSRQLTTVVGNMPGVNTGSILLLTGDYHHDKKYGDQFAVTSFQEILPSGVAGIEKYLGSGMIRGIGPAAAKLIVKKFGRDTIDVLDNHPERLTEVWGIGKKKS